MIPQWVLVGAAYLVDGWVGDPPRWPHPVRWIGALITALERLVRPRTRGPRAELVAGAALAAATVAVSAGAAWAVLRVAGAIHPLVADGVAALGMASLLARRSLADAARSVWAPLHAGDLPHARTAAGQIVGRDTVGLDAGEVARAAIESVAENTSDGVIAPLFYAFIGGLPLMAAYKAVNTLDSMIGYRNDRYLYLGRAAARLDDAANWIPARLAALSLATAAALLHRRGTRAWKAALADARKHPSPNAGWPEAAMAGALGVRLGGTNFYGGVPSHRPVLHGAGRPPAAADLPRAVRLMQTACHLFLLAGLVVSALVHGAGAWVPGR
ncbi:adenosylcobinamide-phosphate synthase CbiB [Caldinitratiruptor microaerophilus]|uniref:Cobalamin biosynthesis protein CobD n=1 Tax=Caldinitratiruptor microaerophilus TaxID=671077 RepID=A0AA35CNM2_9FIRM|nr:adenosylcobinamide-phosphate synthase CbiB [Caldinitratiruptor microaerophilus]BDG60897.1 cobalamin biosynthesis protein CobD [Caldinitratiruptor microaerophilus]